MAGLPEILDYCYGNHPKANKNKQFGEKIIKSLREHGRLSNIELPKELGFNYYDDAQRARFYNIVAPLKKKGAVRTERDNNKTYYYLSRETFNFNLDKLREASKNWLRRT